MKRLIWFLKQLFPESCLICQKYTNSVVCEECISSIPDDSFDFFHEGIPVYSFSSYSNNVVHRLLHEVKFRSDTRSAAVLSEWIMGRVKKDFFQDCDICIPIPIHKRRYRRRGFNHVDTLFFDTFVMFKKTYLCLLDRRVNTPPLFSLDRKKRKKVIHNSFQPHIDYSTMDLSDRTVCICDDIFTTGTTLDEAVRVLRLLGAKKIKCCVLSKA
jgi:competence protein ComFC